MAEVFGSTPLSPEQMRAAVADIIPQPATVTPKSELTGGGIGLQQQRYALEDHQHPRLTSTTYATLDSNGQATIAFSRTFVNKPGLNLTETDAANGSQPLVMRGLTWVRDGSGLYVGVVIEGRRAQVLPTLTVVSGVLSLLSGVISAVNNQIVTPLTKFDVFGGPAVGATVSVIAVARSDMPSN